MVVALVGVPDRPHRAVHVIRLAPLDLDLDGCVPDAEVVPEHPGHGREYLLAAPDALLRDEDVAARGEYPGSDRPDVQVVDPEDPGDPADGPLKGLHIDPLGGRLQEDV